MVVVVIADGVTGTVVKNRNFMVVGVSGDRVIRSIVEDGHFIVVVVVADGVTGAFIENRNFMLVSAAGDRMMGI